MSTTHCAIKVTSEADPGQELPRKDVPDKHGRITHTHDMQQCSHLIRGTKPCKNRCSADSVVCQYHEPSRLAKERGLSILSKRPRGGDIENHAIIGPDGDEEKDSERCVESLEATPLKNRNEITRISCSQNRMYNPLATPLLDVGCVGLPSESNWSSLFKDITLPVHLDIGSARGKFLIDLAEMQTKNNFIGIEIRNKLVEEANEILKVENKNGNCSFFCANLLSESHCLLLESSLSLLDVNRISVLFPDPWIKKKHQARRVIQVPVLISLAKILSKGGELIIASDVEDVIIDAKSKMNECLDYYTPVKSVQKTEIKTDNEIKNTNIKTDIKTPEGPGSACNSTLESTIESDVESVYEIDEEGYVLSNPFKPLASEREQVCEMSWRRVFRLIYIRK